MSKVEDNQENFDICMKYCTPCLTFSDKEGEGLFCARGKSSVPLEKKGCNCGSCLIRQKYSNKGAYYCIGGAE